MSKTGSGPPVVGTGFGVTSVSCTAGAVRVTSIVSGSYPGASATTRAAGKPLATPCIQYTKLCRPAPRKTVIEPRPRVSLSAASMTCVESSERSVMVIGAAVGAGRSPVRAACRPNGWKRLAPSWSLGSGVTLVTVSVTATSRGATPRIVDATVMVAV